MKIQLIYVRSQKESWCEEATEKYLKQINHHCDFVIDEVKGESSLKDPEDRKNSEAKKILKLVKQGYEIILLDEKGKDFKSSKSFSDFLIKNLSHRGVCFVVGGAYGTSELLKNKASHIIQLSALTLNHHVAQLVILEQIYRALCIWKNLPYHND